LPNESEASPLEFQPKNTKNNFVVSQKAVFLHQEIKP